VAWASLIARALDEVRQGAIWADSGELQGTAAAACVVVPVEVGVDRMAVLGWNVAGLQDALTALAVKVSARRTVTLADLALADAGVRHPVLVGAAFNAHATLLIERQPLAGRWVRCIDRTDARAGGYVPDHASNARLLRVAFNTVADIRTPDCASRAGWFHTIADASAPVFVPSLVCVADINLIALTAALVRVPVLVRWAIKNNIADALTEI